MSSQSSAAVVVDAPQRAEALLDKMRRCGIQPTLFSWNSVLKASRSKASAIRIYHAMLDDNIQPDTFTYNLMILAHSNNVTQMEEWKSRMMDNNVPLDRQTYMHVLKCYSQHGQAIQAEQWLLKAIQQSSSSMDGGKATPPHLQPNLAWYSMVIHAYAKSGLPQAGIQADYWLSQLPDVPDVLVYNQVMNAHVSVGNYQRVQEILNTMERPDDVSFTTAMKAAQSPDQAMDLFHRMKARGVEPTIYTYGTFISICAGTNTRDGLYSAMDVLLDLPFLPTCMMYADLIYGWSHSNLREAGYKADQLLADLEELPPSKRKNVQFTSLYNAAIHAWAKSGDKRAPERAEALLDSLQHRYEQGDKTSRPDTTTFVAVSNAYARARIPDAQGRCDKLWGRMQSLMLRPTRALYNSILNALAKSGQLLAVPKAEDILREMQDSDNHDLHPDIVTYASIVDCHTKGGEPSVPARAEELLAFVENKFADGDELLTPNSIFYSAVMQAWSKTATKEGADKAEALLRRNQRLYEEGHQHAKPHAIMYNAVIDAIARSGAPNSGEHADELLQEMEELYQSGDLEMKPSRRSLNAVMLAYRNDVNGGQKAEFILRRMEELTEAGVYDVNPDRIAYNCAISAIASSDDPTAADRAQALFDRMEHMYTNGDWFLKPDGVTYSSVVEAWLQRNDEKGTAMANALLEKFFKEDGQKESDAVWKVISKYSREKSHFDAGVWIGK